MQFGKLHMMHVIYKHVLDNLHSVQQKKGGNIYVWTYCLMLVIAMEHLGLRKVKQTIQMHYYVKCNTNYGYMSQKKHLYGMYGN